MSRDTSLTFRQAIYSPETGEAFIILLEISSSDLSAPIRVCSDAQDITSNGDVYVSYPFDLSLPDDTDEGSPNCTITIDNVDRSLTEGIRSMTKPPAVDIRLVLGSDPDTIEVEFDDFELVNISYDAFVVQGTISIDDYMTEPYPGDTFCPSNTPGLF